MTGEIEEIFFKSAMLLPKLVLFLQISYILTKFSQGMTGENTNLCKGLTLSKYCTTYIGKFGYTGHRKYVGQTLYLVGELVMWLKIKKTILCF